MPINDQMLRIPIRKQRKRPSTAPRQRRYSAEIHKSVQQTARTTSTKASPVVLHAGSLYSRFWRDRAVFDAIADEVLFRVAKARLKAFNSSHHDGVIRAWSCGSSTGEEAYSLSMMWEYHYERLSDQFGPLTLSVLGTDRSRAAINLANSAEYSCHSLHDLPEPLYNAFTIQLNNDEGDQGPEVESEKRKNETTTKYFPPGTEPLGHYTRTGRKQGRRLADEQKAQLVPQISKRCRFHHQDFNESIPVSEGPFDIILARYSVLLYSENGSDIVSQMVKQCLAPGGFLVLGATDNISPPLAEMLHLKPMASKHTDIQCIYQYLPGDQPEIKPVSTSSVPPLPVLSVSSLAHENIQETHLNSNAQKTASVLTFENCNSLGQYSLECLGYIPPTAETFSYITEGSEKLLAGMKTRAPLHIQTRFLPPFARDATAQHHEGLYGNWDQSVKAHGIWALNGDTGGKENQNSSEKHPKRVEVEEMNAIVKRLTNAGKKAEQRRQQKMKEYWKQERKSMKLKKRKERRKRKRLLMKVRRAARLQREKKTNGVRKREKKEEKAVEAEKKASSSIAIPTHRPQTAPNEILHLVPTGIQNSAQIKKFDTQRTSSPQCDNVEDYEWRRIMHMKIRQACE